MWVGLFLFAAEKPDPEPLGTSKQSRPRKRYEPDPFL
jgi:hypothetical protein